MTSCYSECVRDRELQAQHYHTNMYMDYSGIYRMLQDRAMIFTPIALSEFYMVKIQKNWDILSHCRTVISKMCQENCQMTKMCLRTDKIVILPKHKK